MIRVVCADDSPFLRKVLKETLEVTGKIKVVGEAMNGKDAIDRVKALSPDVLILDCEMPVMNGLEALRRIMAECPLPVFIFSSLAQEGASVTLKALEYGAVDYLSKPTAGVHALSEVADEIVQKIELIARKNRFRSPTAKPESSMTVAKSDAPTKPIPCRSVDILAVGSSTGGVQAAVEIITRLPATTSPIVWVQHMPATFTGAFAARLNTLAKIKVVEAKNGQVLESNMCYIAPGGYQMRVRKNAGHTILNIGGTDRVNNFCPSCDVLFDSVAQFYSNNSVGVILTGIGDDGSQGLLKMRKRGAFVIGQNESSCVVYGMPKVAMKIGAVDVETEVERIADLLVKVGAVGK